MATPLTTIDAVRKSCLVIMLKSPPRSKRRLAAEIGDLATTAAEHLADCALEDAAEWPGPVCLAAAAPGDRDWAAAKTGPRQLLVLQAGNNLGERINHVNRSLSARGHARQIFIGTDCPELDADYLRTAAAVLGRHDVVLGPALDGGVVLMGANRPWPDLAALPWSTPALGQRLRALCEAQGWSVAELPPRADVDCADALLAAMPPLARDPRAARRALHRWLVTSAATLRSQR